MNVFLFCCIRYLMRVLIVVLMIPKKTQPARSCNAADICTNCVSTTHADGVPILLIIIIIIYNICIAPYNTIL